uniref:Metal-binding protein n=1 Tax=Paulinella micropora TaxID=1928728 RepID=A0A385I0C9_9EUKA|nr:hypothetical protein PMNZ_377 [Paulinella micropora]AXY63320.1 hypothetical protein PMNZ_377 [Paulinella micropora]
MSSGSSHDKWNYLLSFPFALLCSIDMGWNGFLVGGASFLIGGFWFSPDLDIDSRPTRRWGPLKKLWMPYRQCLGHRSIISHSILLGTISRLTYGMIVLIILASPLCLISVQTIDINLFLQHELPKTRIHLVLCALVGLETSAWLHIIQDCNIFSKN